jgi:hypothetical protein
MEYPDEFERFMSKGKVLMYAGAPLDNDQLKKLFYSAWMNGKKCQIQDDILELRQAVGQKPGEGDIN